MKKEKNTIISMYAKKKKKKEKIEVSQHKFLIKTLK